MGRRAGDRESQKTCRLSRIVNNGKVAGSRYEDTEPLEVEESWVQALSLQKDSRLFYLVASPSLWGAETVRKRQDQLPLVLFILLWILGIYLGTSGDGGRR